MSFLSRALVATTLAFLPGYALLAQGSGVLVLSWDTTQASVPFRVEK